MSHKMPPPTWNVGGGMPCCARSVRSRPWRDLRLHALLVVVAPVAFAAVAIAVAGGFRPTTAAITLFLTALLQPIADDVFELITAAALALPIPVAARLPALAGLRHNIRCRTTAAHEAADPRRRRRLHQPPSSGAGSGQLEEGIERFAVHTVSPIDVHRRQVVIHSGPRPRRGDPHTYLLVHLAGGNGSLPRDHRGSATVALWDEHEPRAQALPPPAAATLQQPARQSTRDPSSALGCRA